MQTPDWLQAGGVLWDGDGERWVIDDVGVERVTVSHAEHGRAALLRSDLVRWVEAGPWEAAD